MTVPIVDQIRRAFDEWTNHWNSGDTAAYLDAYLDSSDTRYVSGKDIVLRGKDAIVQHFVSRGGAAGRLSLINFEVEPMSQMDALVFGQYKLRVGIGSDGDGGGGSGDESATMTHTGCFTVHVRRQVDSTWKILSDHSC
mmetsp:Transcript_43358/g.85199  ORF Transcript_43358/g.85199 Transcript_43358/m.85199 type:complete len:139 (+) Transcript_43358:65-481(+)